MISTTDKDNERTSLITEAPISSFPSHIFMILQDVFDSLEIEVRMSPDGESFSPRRG